VRITSFTAILTMSLSAEGASRRGPALAAGAGRDSCRLVRKPTRGRDRELARHAARGAAPAAANGFFRRDSAPNSVPSWWVPSFLATSLDIEDLAEAQEVRFLANRDANLCFGLLTDFRDAAEETLPEDERCCSKPPGGSRI
jgi:hypothetical protein